MSAPFEGIAPIESTAAGQALREKIAQALRQLSPPRKHYQDYYCSTEANRNMTQSPGGLKHFQRAYYHIKSADWVGNTSPKPLSNGSAATLATMPPYYIMGAHQGMDESVTPHAPIDAEVTANRWLPEKELALFHQEFDRTGFQGGLNWYRAIRTTPLKDLSNMPPTLYQPTLFISGAQDWGTFQKPGALEHMQTNVCANLRGTQLIKSAGHWVQQEQPEETVRLLLNFLRSQE